MLHFLRKRTASCRSGQDFVDAETLFIACGRVMIAGARRSPKERLTCTHTHHPDLLLFMRSFIRLIIPAGTLLICCVLIACTHTSGHRQELAATALLHLHVSPAHTEVYIDERYHGEVAKWRDGVIPLVPGDHRVELRAAGHIAERFDVRMHDRGELTLDVVLEPELTLPSQDDDSSDLPPTPPSPKFPLSTLP